MGYLKILVALTVAWLSCFDLVWDALLRPPTPKNLEQLFFSSFPFKSPSKFKFFKHKKMSPSPAPFLQLVQWLRDAGDEVRFAWSNSYQTRKTCETKFNAVYHAVPHSDLILTAVGTLSIAWLLRRSLHRYKNANDLPLNFFEGRQKRLKGLAISVNDSDNIRFYHQPHLFSLFKPNLSRQDLKYHTINIRLAGIDAPEVIKSN